MRLKSIALIAFIVISVLSTFSAYAFFGFFDGQYSSVKAEGDSVIIPVKDVNDGKAHHFSFKANDQEIHFFVIKSLDGVLRAAFDACDVCFHAKKGYSQSGDYMICNNCGMKFHSTRINEVQGGCNPAPLTRVVQDGKLIIKVADILPGARFF